MVYCSITHCHLFYSMDIQKLEWDEGKWWISNESKDMDYCDIINHGAVTAYLDCPCDKETH